MSEDIKNQAAQMLRRIDNPILQGQVTKIQNEDPMEELKKEVLSFFKTKIAAIKRSEAVKELVYIAVLFGYDKLSVRLVEAVF